MPVNVMPRARRAPGKRPRDPSIAKLRALALEMEVPLQDVENFIHAVRLMGHGIEAFDNPDGSAIAALAWMAAQRLNEVKALWEGMCRPADGL